MLLHAPSGAGKTSLIQAGLQPLLEQRRFRPTLPLRVNTPPPANGAGAQPLRLQRRARPPRRRARARGARRSSTLEQVVEQAAAAARRGLPGAHLRPVRGDPDHRPDRLGGPGRCSSWSSARRSRTAGSGRCSPCGRTTWAGSTRFVRYLPGHLATRYRLDFLDRAAAKVAIQLPAREHGVEFTDEAAAELVRRLATREGPEPGHESTEIEAPYVQPFQLQVVCRRLWNVRREARRATTSVPSSSRTSRSTRTSPEALRSYYAGASRTWPAKTGVAEGGDPRLVREASSSPEQRFRSQTLTGPQSGDVDPREVLEELEAAYLIRSDTRADVYVVRALARHAHRCRSSTTTGRGSAGASSHGSWRARAWGDDRDRPGSCCAARSCRDVTAARDKSRAERGRTQFLEASERAEHEQGGCGAGRRRRRSSGALAIAEAVVIVVLVVLLLR